jgi:hypothetical protein
MLLPAGCRIAATLPHLVRGESTVRLIGCEVARISERTYFTVAEAQPADIDPAVTAATWAFDEGRGLG